ncbi:MAG TPA: hypothetical protein VH280_20275 [Verrucomicrobiae bacterium]|jgi:hypothetical protein|nr:hypothetical protein [Verrucomicrobiae bacterium]
MPIRINLLAEAQAAEEMRRRDPVKRVVVGGILVLAAMAVWSSTLQLKVMMANRELGQVQFQLDSHKKDYDMAVTNNAKIAAIQGKISALGKMVNARMLQGNLLNALQKVSVDNVQLMSIKVDQAYTMSGGTKGKDGIPSKSFATEKIVVVLNARDSSPNPGDQVGKFMQAVARQDYFKQKLGKTNDVVLTDESSPQIDQRSGRTYVSFSVECRFPDYKR